MTDASPISSCVPAIKPVDVLALLSHQGELYGQLDTLAQQQSALIEQGQSDPLLAILAHRQRLIDELVQSNRQLEPARKQWDQMLALMSPADRTQLASLLQRITDLRNRILAQDERDCRQLQESQSRTAAELGQVAKAGLAVNSYQRRPTAWNSTITTTDRQG